MTELKPCPFCGREAQFTLFLGHYVVSCTKCLGAMMLYPTGGGKGVNNLMSERKLVANMWNRRATNGSTD